jgi:nicotinamidase-related amidase
MSKRQSNRQIATVFSHSLPQRAERDMTSNPPEFRPDQAALVIIDTQEKWVPMIPNRHAVVANVRTLIKLARCFEMPIVVAEHLPWVIGETVSELRELLDAKTPVIKKTVYNTFDDPRFAQAIEQTGRRQLLFCGIETHVCMGLPALEAVRRGYQVFVATDCTGAQVESDRDTAFQRFWQAGIVPTTWNTIAFEGLRTIELQDGMPANARSQGISEIWLEALPHVLHQFAYQADKDPAHEPARQASANKRRSA